MGVYPNDRPEKEERNVEKSKNAKKNKKTIVKFKNKNEEFFLLPTPVSQSGGRGVDEKEIKRKANIMLFFPSFSRRTSTVPHMAH